MFKKLGLLTLFLAGLSLLVTAQAKPLQASGVAVKFADWDPIAATYTYKDLKISKRHQSKLVKQGEQYMIPLRKVELRFKANGDVEEVTTYTRYILSQDAVHNYGNMKFWLDAYSSRTSIVQAYSLSPDGKRHGVDPNAIQLQTDQDEDIFGDSFKVIVPYSNIEVNSILVLQTRALHLAAKDVMPWSRIYYPQAFHVRDHYSIHIEWENDDVKPVWKTDFEFMKCKEKARSANCVVSNNKSFADDPDIPRYEDTLPQFAVGKRTKWNALVGMMESVINTRLDDDEAIRAKAKQLVSGVKSDREKIQKLYQFVADDIRYVGLEHGSGGIIPRHTGHTFSRGYGDCKDKASLFVNMARMVGLDAYPVLTSSKRRNPDKLFLPAASYFDHMIACVNPDGGDDVCVDLTNPYSSSNQLSGSMQGAVRLDIRSGVDKITRLPKEHYVWDIALKAVNHFTPSGDIKESLKLQFNGATAAWARGILRPMTRSERESWGSDNYHDAVGNNADPKITISGISNTEQSVAMNSETVYKNIVKKYKSFKRYSEDEFWLKYYYENKKSANKNHPYTFDGMRYHSEVTYVLPDDYVVSYGGADINFDTPYGHFERKYKNEDNSITVYTDFSLPNNSIPVSELSRYNHFIDAVLSNQAIEFGVAAD